ncbi:hypothetical protein HNY73_020710 [Argiope bruennichi]|uniref:Uncharacterized protein n=1 Tax=Argiope bruennichi TaxID=94029 RepID=A0A8T0E7L1_ARGBR|nr:hypothetical protein HNY73_020710 [Argiope bruennichi]
MIFKIFGFLLLSIAGVRADSCNLAEFQKCVSQASDFADGYSFHITSPDEFQESCDTKTAAMDCVNDFVSRCMPGYLSNMDCWKRIANDISHCNANFEKSQMILMQEDMKERLRMFHSCCAYEWHKQCKAKAAESSCSEEAKDYVERVSTLLGGQILAQLCGSSSSDCYGQLYGVNHGAFFYPSALLTLLSFVVTSYF